MASDLNHCAWCGSPVKPKHEDHPQEQLCPECHDIFEAEAHRSLHPMEERHPHND